MNLSAKRVDAVTLFVQDLAATRSFYQDVLGLEMAFQNESSAVFKFQNLMINLLDVSAAAELIAPAAVGSRDAGSRSVFSVFVDSVDAACAELAERGVVLLNGPVDRPWGMRTASFADPAGHIWEIAQDLD
jgi:catechol 2,3-dioxygenase-like lactoylglutathione lyase family enzyme